jgi:hypothetical protein
VLTPKARTATGAVEVTLCVGELRLPDLSEQLLDLVEEEVLQHNDQSAFLAVSESGRESLGSRRNQRCSIFKTSATVLAAFHCG